MCTFKRQVRFVDRTVVTPIFDQLLRTGNEGAVEIMAHGFMPDHFHVLLAGTTESSDLKHCADLFRRRAGCLYRRSHRDRLWQEGYFDRTLRDSDATIDVVAYILNNPVVAGRAKRQASTNSPARVGTPLPISWTRCSGAQIPWINERSAEASRSTYKAPLG